MEEQRYQKEISQISRGSGGRGGGQGRDFWMCGGCDGDGICVHYERGERSGGQSQTIINGVDVSYPTRNFIANKWTRLGWNGGWVYVSQAQERMN